MLAECSALSLRAFHSSETNGYHHGSGLGRAAASHQGWSEVRTPAGGGHDGDRVGWTAGSCFRLSGAIAGNLRVKGVRYMPALGDHILGKWRGRWSADRATECRVRFPRKTALAGGACERSRDVRALACDFLAALGRSRDTLLSRGLFLMAGVLYNVKPSECARNAKCTSSRALGADARRHFSYVRQGCVTSESERRRARLALGSLRGGSSAARPLPG
jgi:hypothetical protein